MRQAARQKKIKRGNLLIRFLLERKQQSHQLIENAEGDSEVMRSFCFGFFGGSGRGSGQEGKSQVRGVDMRKLLVSDLGNEKFFGIVTERRRGQAGSRRRCRHGRSGAFLKRDSTTLRFVSFFNTKATLAPNSSSYWEGGATMATL